MRRLVVALIFLAAAVLALGSYSVFHVKTNDSQVIPTDEPRALLAADREPAELHGYGDVELDLKSDYSTIRVRKRDNTRTLSFVRDATQASHRTKLELSSLLESVGSFVSSACRVGTSGIVGASFTAVGSR